MAVLFLMHLFISNAHAGFITMQTSLEANARRNSLRVVVTATNIGNEPAYHVAAHVEVGADAGAEVGNGLKDGDEQPVLQINEPCLRAFEFDISGLKPGIHPIIVRVDFTDANQYPFSSISVTHFTYKTSRRPQIYGKIDPAIIKHGGKLHVSVKNLDDKPKNTRIRLVLPRELSSADGNRQIALKALEEKMIAFDLSNFSALPGAKHAVFALMEYEENESHLSISIPGTVEVIEKRKLSKTESLLILSIPLALLLGFFGIMIYLKKNVKSRNA